MDNRLHILQHSLGLDPYGDGNQYRNHFVTGPGSSDFDDCRALVADGLMTECAGTGGNEMTTPIAQGPVDVNVGRLAERRDLLDLEYINSLPLPLWDGEWPVYDIEVQTGLYRIDVCGLLDVRHIGRCFTLRDATGKNHYVGDLYLDPDEWEERTAPETPNVK